MHSPTDSFSATFDSIPVTAREREHALSDLAEASASDEPGFSLLDDAGGRFTVDRVSGIISLLDRELLVTEAGQVHPVRIRVVEPSGASYELKFKLRMTGLIPQMLGAEEFDALANLANAATTISPPPAPSIKVTPPAPAPVVARSVWPTLAPLAHEAAPFGALCRIPLPAVDPGAGVLTLPAALPVPGSASAHWTV